LDTQNKHEIVKLLANLNSPQKTTTIMVTHDEQVAASAERILLINDGKIQDKQAQKETFFDNNQKQSSR
jgi:ABC-type lipoprotein export system ATPase subunit